VTQVQGPDILRLKGIIAFKDDDERYVLQGVHMIIEGDHQRAWRAGEARDEPAGLHRPQSRRTIDRLLPRRS
jgi:G3E family GTPase